MDDAGGARPARRWTGAIVFAVVVLAGLLGLGWLGPGGARIVAIAGVLLAGASLTLMFARVRARAPFGGPAGAALGGLALLAISLMVHALASR